MEQQVQPQGLETYLGACRALQLCVPRARATPEELPLRSLSQPRVRASPAPGTGAIVTRTSGRSPLELTGRAQGPQVGVTEQRVIGKLWGDVGTTYSSATP